MARFTKADVEFHREGYAGGQFAAVNVKVYGSFRSVKLPLDLGGVSDDMGKTFRTVTTDEGFTQDWIADNLTDDELNSYFEFACQDSWEQLGTFAAETFGAGYHVHSEGRSGGWALICYGATCGRGLTGRTQFDREDVEGWDAIAVARWARFSAYAKALANDVPRQVVDSIYANRYEPEQEQATIARRLDTYARA